MKRPSRGASWSATTMRYRGTPLRRPGADEYELPYWFLVCELAGESAASERQLQTGASGLPRDLHELLHLLELAQERVDLLYRTARPLCDPEPPLPVDDVGVRPLLGRHREHDGLDMLELLIIQLGGL